MDLQTYGVMNIQVLPVYNVMHGPCHVLIQTAAQRNSGLSTLSANIGKEKFTYTCIPRWGKMVSKCQVTSFRETNEPSLPTHMWGM